MTPEVLSAGEGFLKSAVAVLETAQQPLIWAGGGAMRADAGPAIATLADLDGTLTQNWAMPQLSIMFSVNIDHSDVNKNYRCDLTLTGDARHVVEALVASLGAGESTSRLPVDPR